jgi:hypothetical protein
MLEVLQGIEEIKNGEELRDTTGVDARGGGEHDSQHIQPVIEGQFHCIGLVLVSRLSDSTDDCGNDQYGFRDIERVVDDVSTRQKRLFEEALTCMV